MNYVPEFTKYSAHEHHLHNGPIPSDKYGIKDKKRYDTSYN